ncbi:2-hydroxy-3-oxopropionate reductase [Paenibacillus sp. TAB 01]|uniref:2-hydroxy-3-oxopropionate reductase n=1 Tax=Paenibacillus sp. TAB 01 TaxID=3368988 RepID=UPI003752B368
MCAGRYERTAIQPKHSRTSAKHPINIAQQEDTIEMEIGFIGLGIMGKPMAKHLIASGYRLHVYNRSVRPVEELAALGAKAQPNPRRVAEASDLILTMLPDSPQVEEVILGKDGVLEGISEGKIVVDMSSINPMSARRIAEKLAAAGVHMLDAPVSGGEVGAMEGKLAIMVGGPETVFEQVKPVLGVMGTTITRVGEIGAGNTVKLINQMIVAINIAGVSEAIEFGIRAGIDPKTAYAAIRGGLASSRVLDNKIDNIASRLFQPGFKMQLHEKDLNNAIAMGNGIGANLKLTNQINGMLQELISDGRGSEDHSALFRWYNEQ